MRSEEGRRLLGLSVLLESGTRVGAYEILSSVGVGGMGEVYRARDQKLQRDVALKLLPDAFAGDRDLLARFLREAQVLAALKHPNIVTIHSVEEADGVHFLCMELVEGKSLDALIPANGLDVDRWLEIAVPLSAALAAAHEKDVVHRDLKPANVMVSDDGQVKVLDFGLAKMAGTDAGVGLDSNQATLFKTQAGTVMGTIPYMSPEQLKGGSRTRARTSTLWAPSSTRWRRVAAPSTESPRPSSSRRSCATRRPPSASSEQTCRRVWDERSTAAWKRIPPTASLPGTCTTSSCRCHGHRQIELVGGGAAPRRRATRAMVLGALVTLGVLALAWGTWVFLERSEPAPAPLSLRISPLTSAPGLSLSGSWSPDASQLAFDFTSSGTMDVAVDVAGRRRAARARWRAVRRSDAALVPRRLEDRLPRRRRGGPGRLLGSSHGRRGSAHRLDRVSVSGSVQRAPCDRVATVVARWTIPGLFSPGAGRERGSLPHRAGDGRGDSPHGAAARSPRLPRGLVSRR